MILVQRTRANEQPRELDATSLETAVIHRDQLAKLFGLKSPQMLDVHAHAGIVVRAARKGWFKLGPSITGLVEHQRLVAAKHSSRDGKHDLVKESARLKRAQRELIELRNAQERGELISAQEVLGIFQDLVHHVRGAILCFPKRARAELPHLIYTEVLDFGVDRARTPERVSCPWELSTRVSNPRFSPRYLIRVSPGAVLFEQVTNERRRRVIWETVPVYVFELVRPGVPNDRPMRHWTAACTHTRSGSRRLSYRFTSTSAKARQSGRSRA